MLINSYIDNFYHNITTYVNNYRAYIKCNPDEVKRKEFADQLLSLMEQTLADCSKNQKFDDFATIFAMYCNLIITMGLHLLKIYSPETTFFGISKQNVSELFGETYLQYLSEIFAGIYMQDYAYFQKAAERCPKYSIAWLYLYVDSSVAATDMNPEAEQSMTDCANHLSEPYIEYAVKSHENMTFIRLESFVDYLPYLTFQSQLEKKMQCMQMYFHEMKAAFPQAQNTMELIECIAGNFQCFKNEKQQYIAENLMMMLSGGLQINNNADFDNALSQIAIPKKYPHVSAYAALSEILDRLDTTQDTTEPIRNRDSRDIQERYNFLNLSRTLDISQKQYWYKYLESNRELKKTKKELEEKNKKLTQISQKLKNQVTINEKLVSRLTHSASNYLSPIALAKTGKALQKATDGNPDTERIQKYGLDVMLQSEKEAFISRQISSLVIRCANDTKTISQLIRKGLSGSETVCIADVTAYTMKLLASRIILNDDQRSRFIRKKLFGSDETLLRNVQESFMLEIAPVERTGQNMIDWWKKHIGNLEVSYSPFWNSLQIVWEHMFFDLVSEILTEQLLNALSHGDTTKPFRLTFGETTEEPDNWVFISLENAIGKTYNSGTKIGIETLNHAILALNHEIRGVDTEKKDGIYTMKTWISAKLLK